MKNIAILAAGFANWAGGRDFLRLCINALLSQNAHHFNIHILVPERRRSHRIKRVMSLLSSALLNALKGNFDIAAWAANSGREEILDAFSFANENIPIIFYRDKSSELISALKQINADIVIPAINPLPKDFPFPWVGYIDDFQYKYWPQFFSSQDIESRTKTVSRMLNQADVVIVNAKAVCDDIRRFYPDSKTKVFTLPFSPVPSANWFAEPCEDITRKYSIEGKFFIISNQFWIHKSHITAFRALVLLNQTATEKVSIVCTGNTYDHRFPHYFGELMRNIKEMGIENQIKILGHIPKLDQIQLMKTAIAVLQPTLFEGGPGGGAVYDAVALGIPAIVSDIPVNTEISEDDVLFFKSESAQDLAEKMHEILLKQNQQVKPKQMLIADGQRRSELSGRALVRAMQYVVDRKQA